MIAAGAQPRRRAGVTATGAVYTPRFLADWVGERLLSQIEGHGPIADFACGMGVLLEALACRSPDPLELIGSDVDSAALRKARSKVPIARFKQIDALEASLQGISGLKKDLEVDGLEGVILNPPWGIEVAADREALQNAGFTLARGQYDSADLFLELGVSMLRKGGVAAFILPDSLFFPDRAPMRRFLLENCTLELVARLGEGFFPGVFRGTAVVVARRGAAPPGHKVECVRLTAAQRRLVIGQALTMGEAAAQVAHRVPQSRFAKADGSSFSIDVGEDDLRHVRAIHRREGSWTRTLSSGRGVELSKHGEIVECGNCGRARPRPRKSHSFVCSCGKLLDPALMRARKIVRPIGGRTTANWRPLIAGEDVNRYRSSPGREIRLGVDGINYKVDQPSSEPRLLIRKTGIGLKASLYEGNALTTQTVFHYQAGPESPSFILPYVLGVISSRIMLAVHLKRTGEVEWRSHPYLTQAVLAELPIPQPTPDSTGWKQARALAELATSIEGTPSNTEADLEIERLVAGLYGLNLEDLAWVGRVLEKAQGLEGIASLRIPPGVELTPKIIA